MTTVVVGHLRALGQNFVHTIEHVDELRKLHLRLYSRSFRIQPPTAHLFVWPLTIAGQQLAELLTCGAQQTLDHVATFEILACGIDLTPQLTDARHFHLCSTFSFYDFVS